MATKPDMTAGWEMQLNAISPCETNYLSFMQPLEQTLIQLIDQSRQENMASLRGLKSSKPPLCCNIQALITRRTFAKNTLLIGGFIDDCKGDIK